MNNNGQSHAPDPTTYARSMMPDVVEHLSQDVAWVMMQVDNAFLKKPPERSRVEALADYSQAIFQCVNIGFLDEWLWLMARSSRDSMHPDRCTPFLLMFVQEVLIRQQHVLISNNPGNIPILAGTLMNFRKPTKEQQGLPVVRLSQRWLDQWKKPQFRKEART